MVLQGLQHSIYLGWCSGVLLLKSPRGAPEPFQKKHPLTLLFLLIYLLNLFFRLDFYLLQNSALQNESSVTKFLDLSFLVGETCFDLFFRLTFYFRSKLLVKFIKGLESDMKKFAPSLQLSSKDRNSWKLSVRLVWAILIFHVVAGILVTVWFSNVLTTPFLPFAPATNLLYFLPNSLRSILFYFLGQLPLTCSISVAFSLVVVTTFHILWIFYDFCDTLEEQICIYNGMVEQETTTQLGFAEQALGKVQPFSVFSVAAALKRPTPEKSGKPLGMDKLVGKFEHLKLICGQYDKICGHLLLGLIVRAVYVLISTANSILLYDNPNSVTEKRLKHVLDLFVFPTELAQLWLLPMGAAFRSKMNAKKESLSRKIIFMTNLEKRTDLRNVMTAFVEWQWTLTGGPGFFIVDKSLLSGVNVYSLC